jgi:hypothetical protein
VRVTRVTCSTFSQTGGARIGLFNASWPLATFSATSDRIRLCSVGRECVFLKSQVVLSRYEGFLGPGAGLRIEHANADYPNFIVFWTFRFEALRKGLESLGYEVRQAPLSDPPFSGHPAFPAAWLSFVPVVGVLFGAIAITRGLSSQTRWSKGIAAIGAAGITFNLVLFVLRH